MKTVRIVRCVPVGHGEKSVGLKEDQAQIMTYIQLVEERPDSYPGCRAGGRAAPVSERCAAREVPEDRAGPDLPRASGEDGRRSGFPCLHLDGLHRPMTMRAAAALALALLPVACADSLPPSHVELPGDAGGSGTYWWVQLTPESLEAWDHSSRAIDILDMLDWAARVAEGRAGVRRGHAAGPRSETKAGGVMRQAGRMDAWLERSRQAWRA